MDSPGACVDLVTTLSACAASACAYRLAYQALRLVGPRDVARTSREAGCLQAAALVALGVLWGRGMDRGVWVLAARAASVGFLLHDTHLICTHPALWDLSYLCHHGLVIPLVLYGSAFYPAETALSFYAETTVAPLYLGRLMVAGGWEARRPWLFRLNAALLLVLYLRFRVYGLTAIAWGLRGDPVVAPMLFAFALLNYYWFFFLCMRVARGPRPTGRGSSAADGAGE